jgi:hypothetical protein
MQDALSRWLVQQPVHLLTVAAGHAAIWAILRITVLRTVPRADAFLVPAALWVAYAAWEWLLVRKSPDADIRFDLLLIWPALFAVTLWSVLRAIRGIRNAS